MAVYYNTNRKYVVKTTKGENMKVSFLLETALFQGIAPQELETLLPRLRMHKEQFSKGAIIYHAGERIRELGIVVSGRIQIETYDLWGNRSVLDSIGPKTIFAETYACLPDEVMLVTVSASEDSEVYFLDAHAMIKAASTHPALIQNRVEFSIPLLKQYERAYNPIYPLRQLDNTAMIFIFLLTANSWLII